MIVGGRGGVEGVGGGQAPCFVITAAGPPCPDLTRSFLQNDHFQLKNTSCVINAGMTLHFLNSWFSHPNDSQKASGGSWECSEHAKISCGNLW